MVVGCRGKATLLLVETRHALSLQANQTTIHPNQPTNQSTNLISKQQIISNSRTEMGRTINPRSERIILEKLPILLFESAIPSKKYIP
jgi:hypothetical protein